MLRLLIVTILSICCFPVLAQQVQRLLVTEQKSGDQGYWYLTSYNFRDGIFTSKDTILAKPTYKNAPETPNIGIGGGYLHKNRFLIGKKGAIIDLSIDKPIRHNTDNGHEFVDVIGDTVVYHEYQNGHTGAFYFLDLISLRYQKAAPGFYAYTNMSKWTSRSFPYYSPNGALAVDARTIELYILNTKIPKHEVIKKLSGPNNINFEFSRIAAFWLDDDNLIYDNHIFHKDEKQHTVEIRKYSISTKQESIILSLDSIGVTLLPNGRFSRDYCGNIHYRATNGRKFLLDVHGGEFIADPYIYANGQFAYADHTPSPTSRNQFIGSTFKYMDRVIGTIWSQSPLVATDAIAVAYGDVGSNLGYPKGIKIWTARQNDWITFDVPWVTEVIGWINVSSTCYPLCGTGTTNNPLMNAKNR